jgi:hypothetical protein
MGVKSNSGGSFSLLLVKLKKLTMNSHLLRNYILLDLTFNRFLDKQSNVSLQTWERVILGTNIVKILQEMIILKRRGVEDFEDSI